MEPRRRQKRKFTKVIPLGRFTPFNKENSYEIPLFELIIRKGMGKKYRDRVGNYNPVIGTREYKPSHSYMKHIAKFHPLHKDI